MPPPRESRASRARPARVLLPCSGLDHARRGFESFARECFDALRDEPGVDIELVKGSGPAAPQERSIPSLRRDHGLARGAARVKGVPPFRIEALAFAFSLQPVIARRRPDLIYLSEWDTARGLTAVRSRLGQRFKLLLHHGSFASEGFDHLDRVQELTPAARDYVIEHGADPRRHTVLPDGFHLAPELSAVTPSERSSLRDGLALPLDRRIVVTVAALNRHHKRLDYLIEEVAALPDPKPFLLLVGEPDEETPGLRSLARDRLGHQGHSFRTVAREEVPSLLRASDVFVLASLTEAVGRVLIEAAAHGLPCLAHDSPITRYGLGEHGIFGDFTRRGSLTRLLQELATADPDALAARACAAHRYVYEQFSWDRLRPRYVQLLNDEANAGRIESSP